MIILFMLINPGIALVITPVPFGTIVVPRGSTRPYSAAVDIVILRTHPRVASQQALTALQSDLTFLTDSLRQWNETHSLAESYHERHIALRRTTRHKRWIPFGFIGSLSKGLFGTATTKDVERVKQKLNQLISALIDRDTVIEQNAIALNDTISYSQKMQRYVNKLQLKMGTLRVEIEHIIRSIKAIQRVELQLRTAQLAESVLSTLEFYATQAQIFDQQYLHQRDWVEAGHLTESLVDRATLQRCLDTIRSPLPLDYIYAHTNVHLLRVNDDRLAYIFQLPNTTAESYTAWHILTLPFVHEEQTLLIQPEVVDVAIHASTGAMIDTSDCSFAEPLLCHAPVAQRSLPCVSGILTHEDSLLTKCFVVKNMERLPFLQRIANQLAMTSLRGDTIEERCPEKPPTTTNVSPGTILLEPEDGCTLASAGGGWTFTRPQLTNVTIAIKPEYLMPRINVSFNLPTMPPTIPPMNWTQQLELHRYAGHFAALPRLSKVATVTLADGYVAWAAMAGVILLSVLASLTMMERRWHCLARCCQRSMGRPKAPTIAHDGPTTDVTKPMSSKPNQCPPTPTAPEPRGYTTMAFASP